VTEPNRLTIETKGTQAREVQIDTEEFSELRLSYAQHVYKAQGRTVDQAFVLTGGWQTDRERAYVALTRARDRTDIYVSREDLGEQGMEADTIERLGEAMSESHAQEPSIAAELADERESEVSMMLESQEHARDSGLQIE
jgi:ATP-dependent exoDNAse (exonuclease V) alpha subunit